MEAEKAAENTLPEPSDLMKCASSYQSIKEQIEVKEQIPEVVSSLQRKSSI